MADRWTSATPSWLISFFLNLASHIPSLASSCNNQIPNRTTTSASRGGTSPTRQPVVDDPISVVVDVSPDGVTRTSNACGTISPTSARSSASHGGTSPTLQPVVDNPISVVIEVSPDGATRTSNACGTNSPTSAESSQIRNFNSPQSSPVHPIAVLFRRQELGKAVLGFAVPMTTGLFLNQYQGLTHLQASTFAIALSVGFATTWNGMLLHGIWPRAASTLEYFGVVIILVAFFGLVSSFIPPYLVWACWLCCGLSCLPFLLLLVLPTAVEEASSAERLDPGIV